jgi:hypothetical protein
MTKHATARPIREGLQRCPAHPDRRPSLSVRRGADGRLLVHCFAGCPTERVLIAWGRSWPDLFADQSVEPVRPRATTTAIDPALAVLLRREERAQARLAPYREAFNLADEIRESRQLAALVRQEVTALGECEMAWELAVAATEVDRSADLVEPQLDQALAVAGARRRRCTWRPSWPATA